MRVFGTIRNFLEDKLFGFIIGDDGQQYFIHGNELMRCGLKVPPDKGQRHSFDTETNAKGFRAVRLEAV